MLASTASESQGKTRRESQYPLSSRPEQHRRTERPVVDAYSSYSEWNVDETWSSQEWKSDELIEDRTRRPVVFAQHTDRFIVENDKMNSYTEAESEMSLGPGSFLHKVNDQVRKRQKQSLKDATKTATNILRYGDVFNISSICIHGEELLRQFAFHQKYRRSLNETDVRHLKN